MIALTKLKVAATCLIILLAAIDVSAQSADIYHDHLPEFIEKRNTKGIIRLLHDSIIVQAEVRIGKYKRLQTLGPGSKVSYVFYQTNGKPIGDAVVKDENKGIAILYSNKDQREVKVKFSKNMDEYGRLVFFIKYYIDNKFL